MEPQSQFPPLMWALGLASAGWTVIFAALSLICR